MKVLHVTYSDTGGAGTAALRLHKALLTLDVESKMLVLEKKTESAGVYCFPRNKYWNFFTRVANKLGFPLTIEHANNKVLLANSGDYEFFSFASSSFKKLTDHPLVREADVVHLHWVANFVDYTTFFKNVNKPVVWTQHDMNAFLGGFHYRGDYLRNASHLREVDRRQYDIKQRSLLAISPRNITIVSPSAWMMQEASSSEILRRFPHYHIANGVDPEIFNWKDRLLSKQKFGFSPDKCTVLFVAERIENIRKGFNYICDLVNDHEINLTCEFVAVGEIKSEKKLDGIRYMGSISSEQEISEVYSAADIYLLASNEDNLPNVMLESLAAGTPVVAFNVGGIKELVRNGFNGFLADEFSSQALGGALRKCIDHLQEFDRREISGDLLANYTTATQALSYIKIYKQKIAGAELPDHNSLSGISVLTCKT